MEKTIMIQTCEISSIHRVNEICFHPQKPWILLAVSDGVISAWDYTNCAHLLQLEPAHDGPVQTVAFHLTCSLFVSGGCDGKIKVWDYDEICGIETTFELEGHQASVNDVKFHLEYPWIVSASDDCTVRIWNRLSRSCIAVLSQHSGAVTSASFHPREGSLMLSTSLDGEIRIWDIADLSDSSFPRIETIIRGLCSGWFNKFSNKNNGAARLKNVLKGHKSGVVSAIFHPTLPFVFSASDDGDAYWWKIGETSECFDHQPLHLQTGGISCLAYSSKLNAVVCTADGDNISLFNASSRSSKKPRSLHFSKRDLSCFSAHPSKNFFAIGHSTGMSLQRLMKPPPAFSVVKNFLYHVKDKCLWFYDYSTTKHRVVLGPIDHLRDPTLRPKVPSLSCSPQGNAALISRCDNKSYILVVLDPNDCKNNKVAAKGNGISAVFVALDRFVVLMKCGTSMTKKSHILSVRTLANEVISECVVPSDICSLSSYVGLGNHLLLCKGKDRVVMFDLQNSIVVAELRVSSVRYAFWASYKESPVVALVGNYFIAMADRNLLHLCTFDDVEIIESGAWDEENEGVFIYKTWKHIKYGLVNGHSGTIMMFNEPLYITRASGNTLYCLDEGGNVCEIALDATEFILQSSILNKDYMKQCSLCLR